MSQVIEEHEVRQSVEAPDDGRKLTQFPTLVRAMTKGFLRDKGTLFFAFLFPLLFLFLGGLLFGKIGDARTTIGVVGSGPVIEALARSPAVQTKPVGSVDDARAQVANGDLPAYLVESGRQLTFRFAANGLSNASTVQGLVAGAVSAQNVTATRQAPRFVLDTQQVQSQALATIQYLTPGILSWASSLSAVFGVALTLVNWRRNQVLRRLMLAPVRPITVLGSRVVVILGVALIQATLFTGLAMLPMFGLRLSGYWWLAIPLVILGALAFFAIGMLIGAIFKTEESAAGAGNLIILPMSLLSGSFFPPSLLPGWLQAATDVFPMKQLGNGLTDVMVRDKGFQAVLLPAGYLIIFTLVVGFIAAKMFKWED